MMTKTTSKIITLLLSAGLLSGSLAGCAQTASESNNNANTGNAQTEAASEPAAAENKTEETEAASEAASEADTTADASGFPMDPSVMKPWINSCITGMVTDDVNADLKDDFYLNINHDWLRDKKLRPGYSNEAIIFEAADTVKERCIEILKDKSLTGDDAERIQKFYELWLDWEGRNQVGIEPIKPFVEKVQAISTLDEMSEFIVSEENFKWGTSLASVGLGINADNSDLYEVAISPTALSLEDSAEYKELTENGKRVKKAKDATYTYMLSRIGMSDDEIKQTIEDASSFETLIAAYIKTTLESNDPDALIEGINPVTMDDIKKQSPNYPLAASMENMGWSKSKLINLEEPKWLEGLNEVYTEENLPGIKAYILTQSLGELIKYTDEEAFREYQKINNELDGITESKPDEELAYQDTRESFANCFGRIYVDKYLNEEIKQEITKLCEDSIETYDEMLGSIEWLSDATKKEAQNKLHHMTINAVYPDKWEDDSMYTVKGKDEGGNYLDAMIAYKEAGLKDALGRLNKERDKEIWLTDILETNAFYLPNDNSINIIPGFFSDATYSSDMTIEEKYGALGSVIGHEISHAFDTNGAQYDATGNIKDWWTEEDYAAFEKRAGKLIDYYDKVVAFDDGTEYKGQMVQTEAIADMAGLKCMLKMAEKIDGFDYDKFFRANTRLWARTGTVEKWEAAVMTDTHPLHYLRTNVTLPQFDEFIETYDIKEGDGMYFAPEDRIAVW